MRWAVRRSEQSCRWRSSLGSQRDFRGVGKLPVGIYGPLVLRERAGLLAPLCWPNCTLNNYSHFSLQRKSPAPYSTSWPPPCGCTARRSEGLAGFRLGSSWHCLERWLRPKIIFLSTQLRERMPGQWGDSQSFPGMTIAPLTQPGRGAPAKPGLPGTTLRV